MLQWLLAVERNQNTHTFDIIDYREQDSARRQHVQTILARDVVRNYRSTSELVEELTDVGLPQVADFVRSYIIPSSNSIVWIGEFGEILCNHLVRKKWRFTVPELKLRHKQSRNKAMFLTDLVAFKFHEKTDRCLVLVGEVKTITTRSREVAVQGYQQLAGVTEQRLNEDLLFLKRQLRITKKVWLLSQVKRLFDPYKQQIPLRYDLFLVHEQATWNENAFDDLDNQGVTLSPFRAHLLLIEELKDLINETHDLSVTHAETVAQVAPGRSS